jgi:hypothetical protein
VTEALRRPLLPHPAARWTIGLLCAWELAGLVPGSPVPTLSRVVRSGVAGRAFGAALIAALAHHWFLERG